MKKTTFLISSMLSMSITISAQLTVATNGYVGVQATSDTLLSALCVNSQGNANSKTHIYTASSGINIGLFSNNAASGSGGNFYQGLMGQAPIYGATHLGVVGVAYRSTAGSSGRAFGMQGRVGNATSGYNTGVAGLLYGSNNGTGILGCIGDVTFSMSGRYAGYFRGSVYSSSTVTATSFITNSDERLKSNIKRINSGALNRLLELSPVEYTLQQVYLEEQHSDTLARFGFFSDDVDFSEKHYGLIAQEVQKLYPELVKSDSKGFLSVNYMELIPLLINAVQDLTEQVNDLRMDSERKILANAKTTHSAVLYQNKPNPFSDECKIEFSLPESCNDAAIYLYDMSGVQLAKYPVISRTQNFIIINSHSLKAGMYLYSLIIDGEVIDTKQMILTK